MALLQLTHKQYIQLQQLQQKEKLTFTKPRIFTSLTSLHSTSRTSVYLTHFTPLHFTF
jgi:hypothetical protein